MSKGKLRLRSACGYCLRFNTHITCVDRCIYFFYAISSDYTCESISIITFSRMQPKNVQCQIKQRNCVKEGTHLSAWTSYTKPHPKLQGNQKFYRAIMVNSVNWFPKNPYSECKMNSSSNHMLFIHNYDYFFLVNRKWNEPYASNVDWFWYLVYLPICPLQMKAREIRMNVWLNAKNAINQSAL